MTCCSPTATTGQSPGPPMSAGWRMCPVHFEPMCILMPREGKPILLTGPESDQYALRVGHISDVRVLREFTHPDEDYPYSKIESLAQIVGEACRARGASSKLRVGIAGGSLMNAETTAPLLRAALPGAEWVDVDARSASCAGGNRLPSWR